MMRRRDSHSRRTGCGVLVITVLATCFLLSLNRFLVVSVYEVLVPPNLEYPRLRTMLQFILMIGLLFPEWWVVDRVVSGGRRLFAKPARDDELP